MTRSTRSPLFPLLLAGLFAGCGGGGDSGAPAGAGAPADDPAVAEAATLSDTRVSSAAVVAGADAFATTGAGAVATFAMDFIATAGDGADINAAGDVIGRAYTDPGCGPFCLPPTELFVWHDGKRLALPLLPGVPGYAHRALHINRAGVIAGVADNVGVVLWTPRTTSGYDVRALGFFPGKTSSSVAGLDDQGRLVGWATEGGGIPTATLAFMWSPTQGMVDLTALGYPHQPPLAMSPGGWVVTPTTAYLLGASPVTPKDIPPPPAGFMRPGLNGSAINDDGDQAHFLSSTSSPGLVYPFRLAGGTWQQVSNTASGSLAAWGMGDLDASRTVTFTASGTGMIADGPGGLAQPLAARVSKAYGGAAITEAGSMNPRGEVVAQAMIGRSTRLVKLVPAPACTSNCLVAGSLAGDFVMTAQLASTTCTTNTPPNPVVARVTVRSEADAPLANVQVRGRFLDDYWSDRTVSATTDGAGVATFDHQAACGTGAIAFLVDGATLGTRTLDRTRGRLAAYVIPGIVATTATANRAPSAVATVTCQGLACTFDGTRSTDDASIASYAWRDPNGTLLSTQALWSRTYAQGGWLTAVLTVKDAYGLTGTQSITFNTNVWPATAANLPVAVASVRCTTSGRCTLDGSRSSDPDGTLVGYRWLGNNGATLSTLAVDTVTFKRGGRSSATLEVTDNHGFTARSTVSVVVPK